jgi:hypothetical protein
LSVRRLNHQTVKLLKAIMVISIGLTLMCGACSSLQPPASDKATWEAQQRLEIKQQEAEAASDPLAVSLYWIGLITEGLGNCVR